MGAMVAVVVSWGREVGVGLAVGLAVGVGVGVVSWGREVGVGVGSLTVGRGRGVGVGSGFVQPDTNTIRRRVANPTKIRPMRRIIIAGQELDK